MKKIEEFYRKNLTIGEHSTYHSRVIAFIEKATIVKLSVTADLLAKYKAAHTAEQNIIRMQQGYAETETIAQLDAERDTYLRYAIKLVKDAAEAPIAGIRSAGTLLLPIVKPYSKSADLAYSRETADIVGLASDMSRPELQSAIAQIPALSETLATLATLNTEFEAYVQQRTETAAALPTAAQSKAARIATDELYDDIIEWANASLRFHPSAELDTFVADMNELIRETRNVYNRRVGKPTTDKPSTPDTDQPTTDPDLPTTDPDLPAGN